MFKEYQRKEKAQIRPVVQADIDEYKKNGYIQIGGHTLSISDADKLNGSPKIGDMIGRNPANYSDQWLINAEYFKANFDTVHQVEQPLTEKDALAPHQIRVLEEKAELDKKIVKLQKFIETDDYYAKSLGQPERVDLGNQLMTMVEYSTILQSRINRFI